LHVLEIALRNRTFDAGQTLYVTTRHNGVRCWLDADPAVLLPVVFPSLPPKTQRGDVEVRLNAARELRNRVFHYEPIWNDAKLVSTHRGIVEVCEWLSTPLDNALLVFDGFADVNQSSVERYLRRAVIGATRDR
jgi:hypothetical protein